MKADLAAVCFSSCGFFILSILGYLRSGDLWHACRQGLIGLAVFWVIGHFFGAMLLQILRDAQAPKRE